MKLGFWVKSKLVMLLLLQYNTSKWMFCVRFKEVRSLFSHLKNLIFVRYSNPSTEVILKSLSLKPKTAPASDTFISPSLLVSTGLSTYPSPVVSATFY